MQDKEFGYLQISIRAPTRGATVKVFQFCQRFGISIRAPTRGATEQRWIPVSDCRFQSALPRGERLLLIWKKSRKNRFQSALPRGERPLKSVTSCAIHKFQSALPRGERRLNFFIVYILFRISIRAPTRGATGIGTGTASGSPNFNPRSHEGSDLVQSRFLLLCIISIRAPTRGATTTIPTIPFSTAFQSALPRGERRLKDKNGKLVWEFQSALPRGERRVHHITPIPSLSISIRAPTRGATCARSRAAPNG